MDSKFPIRRIIWLVLVVLIIAAYINTINSPFVYDDKIEVVGNRTIRFIEEWKAILLYNPSRMLLQLTYAFNFNRYEFDPTGYHITNIAIHICSAGACLFMTERLAIIAKLPRPILFASAISVLWLLHPMSTEAVTYITGRSESLCGLFSLIAIGCWANNIQKPNIWWRFASVIATLCAAMSKEVGLIIPAILLALELIFTSKVRWKNYTPFALMLIAGAGTRAFIVYNELQSDNTIGNIAYHLIPREVDRAFLVQILTQMEVWLRYIWLWFVPYPQTIYHHVPDATVISLRTGFIATCWLSTIFFSWRLSRNNQLARFALVAAIIVLLPSSSFAPLKENMAEHRSYQFGLFLLIYVFSYLHHKLAANLIAIIAVILTSVTHIRNTVWSSEVLLWKEATDHSPEVAQVWYGLGDSHRFAKQFEEALTAFHTCTELDPMYLDCWNNLGISHAEMGNPIKAQEVWKKALLYDSSYCKAHTNLGFLAFRMQQWDEALIEFRTAIVYCPNSTIAHYGLGSIYYGPRRDRQKAIYHFDRLLIIDPTFDYASEAREKLLELTW
jgi:protein O-mannosyl-transferase